MTNIVSELTARIESYRTENKKPCKNYATKEAAIRATEKAAKNVGAHFNRNRFISNCAAEAEPARYIVFFIEAWGRWVGAIDMTELLRRPTSTGGYLGIEPGFYKY